MYYFDRCLAYSEKLKQYHYCVSMLLNDVIVIISPGNVLPLFVVNSGDAGGGGGGGASSD